MVRPRSLRSVLIATFVGLGLSALLNVHSLQESAGLLEHGPRRDLAVGAVTPLAMLSAALRLDRPHAALSAAATRLSDGAVATSMALAYADIAPSEPAPVEREEPPAAPSDEPPADTTEAGLGEQSTGLPDRERRAISTQAPLRVWALGDSLLTLPAFDLQQRLYQSGLAWAEHDSRHSTGLARPDNFDWPGEVEERLQTGIPDVVVFMFGANDGTSMVVDQPYKFLPLEEEHWASADGEWAAEYAARVGRLMDRMGRAEAEVIWIGIPPVRDPVRARHCAVLNAVFEAEAASRPDVTFIDTRGMFSGEDVEGTYASTLTDETGERVQVRNPDGVHLNEVGAAMLSEHLYTLIDDAWGLSAPG